jgi:hypothetical protein
MRPETLTPERDVVRLLRIIGRRLLFQHLLQGVAVGGTILALGVAAVRLIELSDRSVAPLIAMAGLAGVGSVIARSHSRTLVAAARAVERAVPSARNVVNTALELHRFPDRAASWMAERVFGDAVETLRSARPGVVVPLGRSAAVAAATLGAAAGSFAIPIAAGGYMDVIRSAGGLPGRHHLTVRLELTPPAYLGLKPTTIAGPDVSAVEGSRLRVTLSGDVERSRIRFGTQPVPSTESQTRVVAELQLSATGYLAIERGGHPEEPVRLIPVTVIPDRSPSVKIDAPARDLIVPDARGAIDVRGTASDDFALHAVSLVYTKVSGSGEQFAFAEGEIPIAVTRESSSAWRATGRISLASLGLQPGDSIVYRVTAQDRRPGGAGRGSSDTYFVEVAGPGQVPLEGFEMPPEQERYALSQQMIVLKIQRLRERRPGMTTQAFQADAAGIAAEQRAVRANFIFLMGGHVEDEDEEAEHSSDIQEGRLENTARREISKAVSHMGATETGLAAFDTAAALAQAKLAVDALQRAFGRNRYILRALASRSRIDMSRRLSGALDDARDATRRLEPGPERPQGRAAREMLVDVLGLLPQIKADPSGPRVRSELSRLAERALATGGGSPEWTQIGRQLLELRERASRDADTERRHRAIVAGLVAQARGSGGAGAPGSTIQHPDRLRSAWAGEADRR